MNEDAGVAADVVRFVAVGDLHVGANDPARVEAAIGGAAKHTDAAFLVVPGDLTNAGSSEQYADLLAITNKLPFPFLGVMGNHEFHAGPSGQNEDARSRFCKALGLERPSFVRRLGTVTLVFVSSDRDIDGCSVDVRDSLDLLEEALEAATGPVIVFCHAPLTGTVGAAEGRKCFLSDDPFFSIGCSAEIREIVRKAGKPVVWISGHTHSPLAAEGLIGTEMIGGVPLHSVNVSSAYFTGREFYQTEPITVFVCTATPDAIEILIENARTGTPIRAERLPFA